MPQLYWIIPLEGGHPDNALPGGRPPHVGGGPIYHPGHPDHGLPSSPGHPSNRPPGSWGGPVDPGFGQGGGSGGYPIYHPGHPSHGLPSGGERPDNALPSGEEIPPEAIQLPEPPPEYSDKVVVAVKRPDGEWQITAYDPDTLPDNALPPAPEPK
jgi:hypothetical protein